MSELPTVEQLNRSTKKAAIAAVAILITIVLPAEYGIDITRVGGLFGLTRMGEIKQSLAAEAKKQDAAKIAAEESGETEIALQEESFEASSSSEEGGSELTAQLLQDTQEDTQKSESISVTIPQDGAAEIKASMRKGDKIQYTWSTVGGALNYNVHGEPTDPAEGSSYEYDKGIRETEKSDSITAVFDGTHGWYFRNRSGQAVTVTINVDGEFSSLSEV